MAWHEMGDMKWVDMKWPDMKWDRSQYFALKVKMFGIFWRFSNFPENSECNGSGEILGIFRRYNESMKSGEWAKRWGESEPPYV